MTVVNPVVGWMRMSEAAHRLQVTMATVRKWVEAGRLHAVRTPYGHLVDPASVEKLAVERAARKQRC